MFKDFADYIVYDLIELESSPLTNALQFFIMDMLKIFILLSLVIYVMGFLRALLRPERVREFIANRGNITSRFMAVGLGAVTPFCSCSSVPLFISFVEARIPLGVTISFLIASPMINEVAVIVLAAVIGWKLTLLYIATGLTIAFLGGFLMERFRPERWVEDYVWNINVGNTVKLDEDKSLLARHNFAFYELKSIVGRIWKYVFIGIALGSILHGYLPNDLVAKYAGSGGFLSVLIAVLIGAPLYSDAVGIIPVAEVLLEKGVAVGTVIAFMMSVAALSLPELIILRKVVKVPFLAIFAGMLVIAFVIVGTLFNFFT